MNLVMKGKKRQFVSHFYLDISYFLILRTVYLK